MVNIYTDASVSTNVAAITHLVLSDDMFIGYNYMTVPNVYKSYIGELVGVREGLKYYLSLKKDPTTVTVYTDSDKVMELMEYPIGKLNGAVYKLCSEIKELCEQCDATVEHYVGHQSNQNPNQIVDHMARSVLRGTLRRGERYEQVKI